MVQESARSGREQKVATEQLFSRFVELGDGLNVTLTSLAAAQLTKEDLTQHAENARQEVKAMFNECAAVGGEARRAELDQQWRLIDARLNALAHDVASSSEEQLAELASKVTDEIRVLEVTVSKKIEDLSDKVGALADKQMTACEALRLEMQNAAMLASPAAFTTTSRPQSGEVLHETVTQPEMAARIDAMASGDNSAVNETAYRMQLNQLVNEVADQFTAKSEVAAAADRQAAAELRASAEVASRELQAMMQSFNLMMLTERQREQLTEQQWKDKLEREETKRAYEQREREEAYAENLRQMVRDAVLSCQVDDDSASREELREMAQALKDLKDQSCHIVNAVAEVKGNVSNMRTELFNMNKRVSTWAQQLMRGDFAVPPYFIVVPVPPPKGLFSSMKYKLLSKTKVSSFSIVHSLLMRVNWVTLDQGYSLPSLNLSLHAYFVSRSPACTRPLFHVRCPFSFAALPHCCQCHLDPITQTGTK